jgi:hypothetical protein
MGARREIARKELYSCMSGKLGLGSTLDLAHRPSRYQTHAFNSVRRISYILQRILKVRDDRGTRIL